MAYKLNWWGMRNSQVISEATFRWEDIPFPWYIALLLMGLAIAGLVLFRRTYSQSNKDNA